MHNDEPTLIDELNRLHLLQEVALAIAHCSPPQVFGIHGDWGLGKTSFLHQLQFYLTGACAHYSNDQINHARSSGATNSFPHISTVWFDAWRYQHEPAPIIALLHEIRAQLAWSKKVRSSLSRSAQVTVRGALLSIEEVTKKIGIQYSTFSDARRTWDGDNLAAALPSHTLRNHLRHTISQLLPRNHKSHPSTPRLVICIDDIDRCDAETAYRLLESLKIYLTLDNCVFVLGMNQKVVEDALANQLNLFPSSLSVNHTENDSIVRYRAAAYLEKLCQNVWHLPIVSEPQLLLTRLLTDTIDSPTALDNITFALQTMTFLPPNPRRLKGLADVIGRFATRFPTNTANLSNVELLLESKLLLIVSYVYHFHGEIYVRWEAEPLFYNKIVDYCRACETDLQILSTLELPGRLVDPGLGPTPAANWQSNFPDPSDARVFWIQALVLEVDQNVNQEDFIRYIRGP